MAAKKSAKKRKGKVSGKKAPSGKQPRISSSAPRRTRNPNLPKPAMLPSETPDYYKKMLNDGEFSDSLIRAALTAALTSSGTDPQKVKEIVNVLIEAARRDPGKVQELRDIAQQYKQKAAAKASELKQEASNYNAAKQRLKDGDPDRGDMGKVHGNDINNYLRLAMNVGATAVGNYVGLSKPLQHGVAHLINTAPISKETTAGWGDWAYDAYNDPAELINRNADDMTPYLTSDLYDSMTGYFGGATAVVKQAKNKHKKSVTNKVYKVARAANTGTPISVAMVADLHAAAVVAGNSPAELATASGGGVVDDYVLQQFQAALTLAGE